MATLYLAERSGAAGFSKHVAIKVVHPHLAEDEYFVSMFLDEARLSARIQHPNVVHVEQLGNIGPTFYLVMELVHGVNLGTFLRALHKQGRRLSPELAVHIALAIADGLHGAHETKDPTGKLLGVVHRDVSPDNVLLSYQGHVKLIDFGVAKAQGRLSRTEAQTIKGKFRYMSPEHAKGKPVDRRSDVYSLAVVLWEMLCGRRLFDAPDQWILLNQVQEPKAIPPSTIAPEVTKPLDEAVLEALSVDPDERPATALSFRRRLGDALPSAFSVTAPELSELIRHVHADRLEAEQQLLPQELSSAGTGVEGTMALKDEDILTSLTLESDVVSASVTPSSEDSPPLGTVPASGATRPSLWGVDPARLAMIGGVLAGALVVGAAFGLAGSADEPGEKEPKPPAAASAPQVAPAAEEERADREPRVPVNPVPVEAADTMTASALPGERAAATSRGSVAPGDGDRASDGDGDGADEGDVTESGSGDPAAPIETETEGETEPVIAEPRPRPRRRNRTRPSSQAEPSMRRGAVFAEDVF